MKIDTCTYSSHQYDEKSHLDTWIITNLLFMNPKLIVVAVFVFVWSTECVAVIVVLICVRLKWTDVCWISVWVWTQNSLRLWRALISTTPRPSLTRLVHDYIGP